MSTDITPNEILHKEFSQSLRGFKAEEVKDFLKQVAAALEDLLRQNMFLDDKINQLEEAVEEYRQMENTLKTKAQLEAFRGEEDGSVTFSKINGIARRDGKPTVLIDGTVYDEGSTFGEYMIVKITDQQITLINKKTDAIKILYVFE